MFRSFLILASMAVMLLLPLSVHAVADDLVIDEWQIQWINESAASLDTPPAGGEWLTAGAGSFGSRLPEGTNGLWVRVELPPAPQFMRPALYIEHLYAEDLVVFVNGSRIYESERGFRFDLNKLFVPLQDMSEPSELHIRINAQDERAGLMSNIHIGEADSLGMQFVRSELPDLLLGSGIVLFGIVMIPCVVFLNRKLRGPWIMLGFIALATGLLITTYSPIMYMLYDKCGNVLLFIFNLCLISVIPLFLYYIEHVLEQRSKLLIFARRFQTMYSLVCLLLLAAANWKEDTFYGLFQFFSGQLFGPIIFAELLLAVVLSFRHAASGNKNALILSLGISIFSLSVIADLALYYASSKQHVLWIWKIGVIATLFTLVVTLARRLAADHAMVVAYSKELEEYNVRLQRTEKLKIISDLAASVAHEVRNPLQVTRGFLQLLSERGHPNKQYYEMAITELDRASSIITDFLTFAKPEMDQFTLLDVEEELEKISAIMTPHASLNGVILQMETHGPLNVMGNSSKFKQAIMNFIKNSIEAIEQNGEIFMRAFRDGDEAVIRIRDNGEGMLPEEIAKLGAPYFSTKTKGTGLGLMVTFRIIEAMKGSIAFESEKGKGTEVTLRFPLAD